MIDVIIVIGVMIRVIADLGVGMLGLVIMVGRVTKMGIIVVLVRLLIVVR